MKTTVIYFTSLTLLLTSGWGVSAVCQDLITSSFSDASTITSATTASEVISSDKTASNAGSTSDNTSDVSGDEISTSIDELIDDLKKQREAEESYGDSESKHVSKKSEDEVSFRHVVIHVPSRKLAVYDGMEIIKIFPVGVGRQSFPTPEGRFHVIRKITEPAWENPYRAPGAQRIAAGKGNPLGTRWIGFLRDRKGEYGIHGTDNPGSVGKLSSHGCVRMYIKHAEALFEMVKIGTPVEVSYDNVFMDKDEDGKITIRVYPDAFGKGTLSNKAVHQLIEKRFGQLTALDQIKLTAALKTQTGQPMEVGQVLKVIEHVEADVAGRIMNPSRMSLPNQEIEEVEDIVEEGGSVSPANTATNDLEEDDENSVISNTDFLPVEEVEEQGAPSSETEVTEIKPVSNTTSNTGTVQIHEPKKQSVVTPLTIRDMEKQLELVKRNQIP